MKCNIGTSYNINNNILYVDNNIENSHVNTIQFNIFNLIHKEIHQSTWR